MENNRIDFISSLNLSKPENLNKFSKETMVGTGEKIERKV